MKKNLSPQGAYFQRGEGNQVSKVTSDSDTFNNDSRAEQWAGKSLGKGDRP